MGVTVTGLTELEADLQRAVDEAAGETKKVVSKGALNIKRDAKARWSGLRHAPALPGAVTYDVESSGSGASAEIGPDKGRPQGALGNLLEYGSVNNAPIPALSPALDAEEPRFTAAMEELGARLLDGGPLGAGARESG
jgi:hypothetical protein